MVILVDTNILMDVIANREPYAEYGKQILEKCTSYHIKVSYASHSLSKL